MPCRHLIALVTKQPGLEFENLPFNPRWRKDFYIEALDDKEPERIFQEEDEEQKSEGIIDGNSQNQCESNTNQVQHQTKTSAKKVYLILG